MLRQEYLTYIGSCARDLSPTTVYDANREGAKVQLKANNFLGKVMKFKLKEFIDKMKRQMKNIQNRLAMEMFHIPALVKKNIELKRKCIALDNTMP